VLPRAYVPGPGLPYRPYSWFYGPIVAAPGVDVSVPAYRTPKKLRLRFGDPTLGTAEDVMGHWVVDPERSAAVLKAWLTHVMRAHGSKQDLDASKLEDEFEELDAKLALAADETYILTLQSKDGDEPMEWRGNWTFEEGVLDLKGTEDVDGVPVETDPVYEFNYYNNKKFVGLVVVNHELGLVMARPE
jgi:hypothetical protein